jgi:hypothetical protein
MSISFNNITKIPSDSWILWKISETLPARLKVKLKILCSRVLFNLRYKLHDLVILGITKTKLLLTAYPSRQNIKDKSMHTIK